MFSSYGKNQSHRTKSLLEIQEEEARMMMKHKQQKQQMQSQRIQKQVYIHCLNECALCTFNSRFFSVNGGSFVISHNAAYREYREIFHRIEDLQGHTL